MAHQVSYTFCFQGEFPVFLNKIKDTDAYERVYYNVLIHYLDTKTTKAHFVDLVICNPM